MQKGLLGRDQIPVYYPNEIPGISELQREKKM